MKLRVLTLLILSSLALTSVWSSSVWAQDGGSQVGMLLGLSVPDADNTVPRLIYGFHGSAFLSSNFSLGGYYLLHGKDEGAGGRKFKISIHGLEGAYHIPSGGGDTYVALRAGMTKIHEADPTTATPLIFSPYHYGIATGYDYYVTEWLSMGFEGSFVRVENSVTTLNSTQYKEETFNIISFLLSIQFRL